MAFGTLKADTLTHSTAGSLATNFVVQGSAKAWRKYDTNGGTTNTESFNYSSITDETTGTTTVTFTGAMGNANYSIKGQNSDGSLSLQVVDTNQATSAYRQRTLDGSAQLADDSAVYGDIHGDLA